MEPTIGEIRMFAGDYAPEGWALCDGSLLPISGNDMLFALLDTTYGGNGYENFGVPDLRGRVPVYAGAGPGLTPVGLGQQGGSEQVSLTGANLPPHTHQLKAVNTLGTTTNPKDNMIAITATSKEAYVKNVAETGQPLPVTAGMHASSVSVTGQNRPVSIVQPFLAINFIIATSGLSPSFN